MDSVNAFYQRFDAHLQGGGDCPSFLQDALAQAGDNPPLSITIYNELGAHYRGASQYQASIHAFTAAKALVATHLSTQSIQYATVVNNLAGTYRMMGDYFAAANWFSQAIDTYVAAGGKDTPPYASALNNLAMVHLLQKNLPQAYDCLEEAEAVIAHFPDYEVERASMDCNFAAYYQANSQWAQAATYYQRAMEVYHRHPQYQHHYGAALNGLANLRFKEGDLTGALSLFQQGVQSTAQFFGENEEYIQGLQNVAWVHQALEDFPQALAVLRQALSISAPLLGATHRRTLQLKGDIARLEGLVKA